MRQLKKLILIEVRTFLKISISFFFSFVFPIFLMLVIMMSTGNPLIDDTYHLINKYVIISYVIGLVPLSLISFPISVASDFEYGIIERYKLFKISMTKVFIAKFLVNFVAIIIQIIVITLVACFFKFKLPPIYTIMKFSFYYILITLNLFALGWILACALKNVNKVQIIGMTLMFVFLAVSGAFGEFENLPQGFSYVTYVVPTYDITNALSNLWLGYKVELNPILIKYVIYDGILILLALLLGKTKFKRFNVKNIKRSCKFKFDS